MAGSGVLIAFPLLFVAFIITDSFWLSIAFYQVNFFFSEVWSAPVISTLQNIYPSEIIGSAIAIYFLVGGLGGALSNLLAGILNDKFKTEEHPEIARYIIIIVSAFSLLG
jgi:sugar phosphate permease